MQYFCRSSQYFVDNNFLCIRCVSNCFCQWSCNTIILLVQAAAVFHVRHNNFIYSKNLYIIILAADGLVNASRHVEMDSDGCGSGGGHVEIVVVVVDTCKAISSVAFLNNQQGFKKKEKHTILNLSVSFSSVGVLRRWYYK